MCEPTTMFLLSSGMAIANHVGQKEMMKSRADSITKSQGIQQGQMVEQANMNSFTQGITARKQQARILAAAGDSGVTGNSVAAQLLDSMFNAGQNEAINANNLDNSVEASVAKRDSALSGLSAPSLLNTGLQIGAGYAKTEYMKGLTVDAQSKP